MDDFLTARFQKVAILKKKEVLSKQSIHEADI